LPREPDQPVVDGRGQVRPRAFGQQCRGRLRRQAFDEQLGQPVALEPALLPQPHGEQHHDALGLQAPRDEEQRLERRLIEPMRVVDDAQQAAFLRRLGEQAEQRDRGEEAVADGRRLEPERGGERMALLRWQVVEVAQHGAQ
jgi:hypothetical protein